MATTPRTPNYLLVTLSGQAEALEAAAMALFDCGAQGVEEEEFAGGVRVRAYFPQEDWPRLKPRLLGRLNQVIRYFPSVVLCQESLLEGEDWRETWKKYHRPVVAGPFWIGPPWLEAEAPADLIKLLIDPAQAFGTGSHATTRLCLEALIALVPQAPPPVMLDVGTGSGILALASLKLGAGRAVALDVDEEALKVAVDNARRNGLADRVEFSSRLLSGEAADYPLVTANLTGPILKSLAHELSRVVAPGGRLVVSGVLVDEAEQVHAALSDALGRPRETADIVRSGEWAGMCLGKPGR